MAEMYKIETCKEYEEYNEDGSHIRLTYALENLRKYDKNNNCIYSRSFQEGEQSDEWWYEYDENNNRIHFKDCNGYERWYRYNDNGQQTYFTDYSIEEWYEYNDKGNLILVHRRHPSGLEEWKEYDENNNLIHYKHSKGYECWYRYNDKGQKIYFSDCIDNGMS